MTMQTPIPQPMFSLRCAIIERGGPAPPLGSRRTIRLVIGTVNGSFRIFSRSHLTSASRRLRTCRFRACASLIANIAFWWKVGVPLTDW